MDKSQGRFVILDALLMMAQVLVAPVAMVIVEWAKGPGYASKSSEIMTYVTIGVLLLGVLRQQNLIRAVKHEAPATETEDTA